MDEFSFIDQIKQGTYRQPSIVKGVGDDAAIFRPAGFDVVTAVDTFVQDVHFSTSTMEAFHIGYKALAANISDLAAMGAEPKFYLVSIVVPDALSDNDLVDIFRGMRELAAVYGIDLIGGDTVSGQELTLSVTIIGYVRRGRARYRHTAEPGDLVFTTGTLGDAAAGLYILQNNHKTADHTYLIKRHQMPRPRIDFVKMTQDFNRITLNDVSDGIASELHEIAAASNLKIIIEDAQIPISNALKTFPLAQQTEWKYRGGEDFELIGTIGAEDFIKLTEIAKKQNVLITKIGHVAYNEKSVGQVFVEKDQVRIPLKKLGYTHLK